MTSRRMFCIHNAAAAALTAALAGCSSTPPIANVTKTDLLNVSANEQRQMLTQADAARERGRFSEALRIYQGLEQETDDNRQAKMGIAECLLALGNPRES